MQLSLTILERWFTRISAKGNQNGSSSSPVDSGSGSGVMAA